MKTMILVFLLANKLTFNNSVFTGDPVADAKVTYGFQITAAGGWLVTLDGSKSNDPDGYITRYNWTQVGSSPNAAHITHSAAAITTVAPSTWLLGVYTFQLIVTNNKGATGTAIVKVTVANSAYVPPAFKF